MSVLVESMMKHLFHVECTNVQLVSQSSSVTCLTRSSAMAEGERDALVNIEKSLESMNDLDIQLLLLSGHTAYHFLFVDCCFTIFI